MFNSMVKCVKCFSAAAVVRAGFTSGRQRFCCKSCVYYFVEASTLPAEFKKLRQTTLHDVAKASGVAISTVSRALNGNTDISPATREAIESVAHQLDYRPNLRAQSSKNSETRTIGVVVPDLARPYFATVVSGIHLIAAEAGYRVMITQSKESYAAEVHNVQALIASRVDGLLICHARDIPDFNHVLPPACRGIPVVEFDRVSNEGVNSQVVLDNWTGAFAITEHLIQQECRRIAVLAGPASLLLSQQRVAGYREALLHYGQVVRSEYYQYSNFTAEAAVAALEHWLALPEPPDAILTVNHTNAFEIIRALKQRGRRVPEDVAVAGFGDEYLASLLEPGLTTVDLHPDHMGQQAARLFLEQVHQKKMFRPRTCMIPSDLVIRQSSLKGKDAPFQLSV